MLKLNRNTGCADYYIKYTRWYVSQKCCNVVCKDTFFIGRCFFAYTITGLLWDRNKHGDMQIIPLNFDPNLVCYLRKFNDLWLFAYYILNPAYMLSYFQIRYVIKHPDQTVQARINPIYGNLVHDNLILTELAIHKEMTNLTVTTSTGDHHSSLFLCWRRSWIILPLINIHDSHDNLARSSIQKIRFIQNNAEFQYCSHIQPSSVASVLVKMSESDIID